jgi:glutathione synthase
VRTDAPFDQAYLQATPAPRARAQTRPVVNDPRGLRDANEKLYELHFPPNTIVTNQATRIGDLSVHWADAVSSSR